MYNELYHHGILGQRWGVRRFQNKDGSLTSAGKKRYDTGEANGKSVGDKYREAKNAKKEANRQYSKDFNRAHNYSSTHPISQFVGKKAKAESEDRWGKAYDSAANLRKAEEAYKSAKKERKEALKETHKKINESTSLGQKMLFNDATRAKAAKYVVDKNMSIDDAKKKANRDAVINTVAILAAVGAYELYNRKL